MAQERSAGSVIYRKGRGRMLYLLLHYAAGHWDFVKGKIEPGESEMGAVVREAREETGLEGLKFSGGFEERFEYSYKKGDATVQKGVVFFLARANTDEITLSHEHIDYAWLPYREARERLTYENARRVLEKANLFLVSG